MSRSCRRRLQGVLTWDQISHALARAAEAEPHIVQVPSELIALAGGS